MGRMLMKMNMITTHTDNKFSGITYLLTYSVYIPANFALFADFFFGWVIICSTLPSRGTGKLWFCLGNFYARQGEHS